MRRNNGMGILEIVIALAVFAIGISGITKFFANIHRGTMVARNNSQAALLGKNLLEILRSKKWDENTGNPLNAKPNYVDAVRRSTIGPDGAETTLPQDAKLQFFNDIDDFHNYEDHPNDMFTRKVTVQYATVSPTTAGTVTTSGGATDFKWVQISVTWKDSETHTQVIQAIMANGV